MLHTLIFTQTHIPLHICPHTTQKAFNIFFSPLAKNEYTFVQYFIAVRSCVSCCTSTVSFISFNFAGSNWNVIETGNQFFFCQSLFSPAFSYVPISTHTKETCFPQVYLYIYSLILFFIYQACFFFKHVGKLFGGIVRVLVYLRILACRVCDVTIACWLRQKTEKQTTCISTKLPCNQTCLPNKYCLMSLDGESKTRIVEQE